MIYIKQGDSETFVIGPIETCDNKPVDLSAATVKMIIKQSMDTSDSDANISQSVKNPDTNIIAFNLTAAETAALLPGEYVFGIKIVWNSGAAREIKREKIQVKQGVFNDTAN